MESLDGEKVRAAFKNCTWGNTSESADDWLRILNGNDESAKNRLFNKIFLESSNASWIRSLFSADQIMEYLKEFNRPLHRSHLERRRKVWRFLYLGERVPVPELDWVIRK